MIRGARQVGKTYSVTEFGQQAFRHFVRVDFEKQVQLRKVFDGDLSPDRIIQLMEIETGMDIAIGETLLFLDEIQLCPRALTALRYFYEETPSLHVVAAGSLLEFEMDRLSFPVGRVEFMYMYPLTFEEFLLNLGQEHLGECRPRLLETTPVEDLIHSRLLERLRDFLVVGGMPEAVRVYIESESFNAVHQVHEDLINGLIQDMLKYEKYLDNDLVREVLETIPRYVGSTVK